MAEPCCCGALDCQRCFPDQTKRPLPPHLYATRGVGQCPMCDESDYTGESVEFWGDQVTQACWCANCGSSWVDVYKLEGYTHFRQPEPAPEDMG